ncbi:virginiamycin B lyase [Streptomyces albidoflavus]|uniref:Vgb family protein n=1 Tax=Streptomyces albidoflavus TaxID=1886 RepID=UPI002E318E92|nr:virginiamycin B lyase [Streptomyces albidoflavus]
MHLPDPPSVEEIPVGDEKDGPYGIASGAGGALWLTFAGSGRIARLAPGGGLRTYALDASGCRPTVITPGPDGALWFTRHGDHRIGRVTVDGDSTSFPLPTPDSGPFGITAGPDGALWFTETRTDRVGRITVAGEVTEFGLPGTAPGALPSAITAGPDGALWCTLNQADAIGRVTVDGEVTTYPLPTSGAAPVGITSDGTALWFVEIGAGRIGRAPFLAPVARRPFLHRFPVIRLTPTIRHASRLLTPWSMSRKYSSRSRTRAFRPCGRPRFPRISKSIAPLQLGCCNDH